MKLGCLARRHMRCLPTVLNYDFGIDELSTPAPNASSHDRDEDPLPCQPRRRLSSSPRSPRFTAYAIEILSLGLAGVSVPDALIQPIRVHEAVLLDLSTTARLSFGGDDLRRGSGHALHPALVVPTALAMVVRVTWVC